MYDSQNANYRERLIEKDAEIRRLRAELVSRGTMNAVEPARPRITEVPVLDASLDWQGELNKMLQEEDENVRIYGERRKEVHESATDETA